MTFNTVPPTENILLFSLFMLLLLHPSRQYKSKDITIFTLTHFEFIKNTYIPRRSCLYNSENELQQHSVLFQNSQLTQVRELEVIFHHQNQSTLI